MQEITNFKARPSIISATSASVELKITESGVRRVSKSVKTGKAEGPDGITPHALKWCFNQLLFLTTFLTCHYLSVWFPLV